MNNNTDDNRPSGVEPHAQVSWRSKYEYMNRLWLEQKNEIMTLQKEKQKRDEDMRSLANVELAKNIAHIATLEKEVARLDTELSKKNIEFAALILSTDKLQTTTGDTSLMAEVVLEDKTKAEEERLVKNTKTAVSMSKHWATCLTIVLIKLVLILIIYRYYKKVSLPLLAIGENTLLMLSSP